MDSNNALQPDKVHLRNHEHDGRLRRGHPLRVRRYGLLQHLCHLGSPPLGGWEGGDAPGEEEGLQDGAEKPGHHCGQLPDPRGHHALRARILVHRVPLLHQHHCVLHHGPELHHRAPPLHHKDGEIKRNVLQAGLYREPT